MARNTLASDARIQQQLKEWNETRGIYFVVNAGGDTNESINRVNAVFCEIDDKPIQDQHDIFDNIAPLSPSIRVETKRSVHAYWLLNEEISVQHYENLQRGLIRFFNSDPSITNSSRVMRVPYFNHVDYDEGYSFKQVTIHTLNDWTYSLAELQEAFPYIAEAKPKMVWEPMPLDTFEGVMAELRHRIMNLPSYTSHGEWGCASGVCHEGRSDTALTVNLASGAVFCWSECNLEKILGAFGLELPKRKGDWQFVPRREQKSDLYQWYQERKKAR